MNKETHVWYVSYGSNLYRDRFMTYIKGGTAGARSYIGARDRDDPKDDRKVILPHPLTFAGESSVWGGGVAFLDHRTHGKSVGRAYLVTWEQFVDVVTQENLLEERVAFIKDENGYQLKGEIVSQYVVPDYDRIISFGMIDGVEVLTFSSSSLDIWEPAPAGEQYADMIARGIAETHLRPILELPAYTRVLSNVSS